MKHVKTDSISTTVGFPVKSGTLQHIQAAYGEAISEVVKAITGYNYDPTKAYILNGCVNSGSGSNYIISAGSVFLNGEVYLVDAATFTLSGSNVAVGKITESFFSAFNADSVEFTDGTLRNVHQILKMVIQAGLSGSGDANFLDFVRLNLNIAQINLSATGLSSVSGTYPDVVVNTPPPAPTFLKTGTTHIGDVFGGSSPSDAHAIVFDEPLVTASYWVMCGIISNGPNRPQDASITVATYAYTTAGFTAHFNEYASGVQDITLGWAIVPL